MTTNPFTTSDIQTGICVAATTPKELGNITGIRRVTIVAAAGAAAKITAQGQPATGGFPIPNISADGSYTPLVFEVASMGLLYISGTGNVNWMVEYD